MNLTSTTGQTNNAAIADKREHHHSNPQRSSGTAAVIILYHKTRKAPAEKTMWRMRMEEDMKACVGKLNHVGKMAGQFPLVDIKAVAKL